VINEIENVKSEVKTEFDDIITQAKDLTKESKDFADRVHNLKSKLVRADLVFELLDEIRTGELRNFAVNSYNDLNTNFAQTLQEVIATGQSIGTLRSASGLISTLAKILGVWIQVGKIVHTLRNVLPVIQQVEAKITKFEGIILQQTNRRKIEKLADGKAIKIRVGKLHAS
jgi:hypothetical protein